MNFAVVFGASLWSGYALPACHPENGTPRRQPAELPLIKRENLSRQSRPPLVKGVVRPESSAVRLPVESEFPGLKAGDQWCVCITRWKESFEAGMACPVDLEATHMHALEFVDLEDLKRYAVRSANPEV